MMIMMMTISGKAVVAAYVVFLLFAFYATHKSKGKVDHALLESVGGCTSPTSRP